MYYLQESQRRMMQIRGSQGYNNASLRLYLDIIVGDIEGDIGATRAGARRGRLGRGGGGDRAS